MTSTANEIRVANRCINALTISGSAQAASELLTVMIGPTGLLDFERLLPTPADKRGRDTDTTLELAVLLTADPSLIMELADSEAGGERLWRMAHWGSRTVPEMRLDETSSGPGHLVFVFQSANTPPDMAIAAMSARWPELAFELLWIEPTNEVGGRFLFMAGQTISAAAVNDLAGARELFGGTVLADALGWERAADA